MPPDSVARLPEIRRRILRWYGEKGRDFMWRASGEPYTILVSEVMLQQTQAARIQEKLPLFLKKFPTLLSLAHAPRGEVIRAWRGIGYNNRAVRLHSLARTVLANYGGRLPESIAELEMLPGIGRYTAHAVACFAFGRHVPVVDVNVHRVLSRIFWKMKDNSDRQKRAAVWMLAEKILPDDAYSWNQSVMELGATVCKGQKPACALCPVNRLCSSAHLERELFRHAPSTRRRRRKSEPSYAGIPRRLWRGRIVEALRNVEDDRPLSVPDLGTAIKSDFRASELPWLIGMINRLAEDGVLHRLGASRNLRVSLTVQ